MVGGGGYAERFQGVALDSGGFGQKDEPARVRARSQPSHYASAGTHPRTCRQNTCQLVESQAMPQHGERDAECRAARVLLEELGDETMTADQ